MYIYVFIYEHIRMYASEHIYIAPSVILPEDANEAWLFDRSVVEYIVSRCWQKRRFCYHLKDVRRDRYRIYCALW